MAWVIATLVYVHTAETTVVLEASFATTRSLTITNDAGAVRTTVYSVTGIFADKVETLSVKGAVRVVQTVHLLAARLVIVCVAGKKTNVGTFALHLMV